MRQYLYFYAFFFFFFSSLPAQSIDVIIPCCERDHQILHKCIEGIRTHCHQVRRIIVVSSTQLTDKAEWVCETACPFDKFTIACEFFKGDVHASRAYTKEANTRVGWYYQQLLKLYVYRVIPHLTSNVLVLDADTIFLNPVEFIREDNVALYNVGKEYHRPYFEHGSRLIPGFRRLFPKFSGICHHMLLQRDVLNDLLQMVEQEQGVEFWKAFCRSVDKMQVYKSGASEYEIYFNFVFLKGYPAKIRKLKWKNVSSLKRIEKYRADGYVYVSCHSHSRSNSEKSGE